jgi:hypothetical protein
VAIEQSEPASAVTARLAEHDASPPVEPGTRTFAGCLDRDEVDGV